MPRQPAPLSYDCGLSAVLGRLPGSLRLRCGRRGERIGTFPRHFRGRDRVGWPWFEVEAGPDDRVRSIVARQLLVA